MAAAVPAFAADPGTWYREHATPIVLNGPGSTAAEALDAIVGDARVIGLGEATHGTGEFDVLHMQFVEHLAERGPVVVALEASMATVGPLDDWIHGGDGDVDDLMDTWRYGAWDTWDMRDFLVGMRGLVEQGLAVSLTGVDVMHPEVAAARLRRFVAEYDSAWLATYDEEAAWTVVDPGYAAGTPIDATGRVGQEVRATGWARGGVSLWVCAWGAGAPLGCASGKSGAGSERWRPVEAALLLPVGIEEIRWYAQAQSTKAGWLDDVALLGPAGERLAAADFESEDSTLRPQPGQLGVRVVDDPNSARHGEGALRLAFDGEERWAENEAAARRIRTHLEDAAARYIEAAGAGAVARAIQDAQLMVQLPHLYQGTMWEADTGRDLAMAENVLWVLEQQPPEARVVVWAHNGHVGRTGDRMGTHLAAWLGADYVPVALTTLRGTYTAFRPGDPSEDATGLATWRLRPAPRLSLEGAFATTPGWGQVIDLRSGMADRIGSSSFRMIGATKQQRVQFIHLRLYEAFDAVVVVTATHGTRPRLAAGAAP